MTSFDEICKLKKILEYAKAKNLIIDESSDAIHIIFYADPSYEIRITIPSGICEWFIEIREIGSAIQVFYDWADHYHLGPEDETDLNEEREDSVIKVIEALNGAELRIGRSKSCRFLKYRILEVNTESGWTNLWEIT